MKKTSLNKIKRIVNVLSLSSPKNFPSDLFFPAKIDYFFAGAPIGIHVVKPSIEESRLEDLELFFKKYKQMSAFETPYPFFCEFEHLLNTKSLKLLEKKGWQTSNTQHNLNIWNKQMPFNLPKGYSVTLFDCKNKSELNEHYNLISLCFKTDLFGPTLNKFFKKHPDVMYMVNIRSGSGVVCATGAVGFNGEIGGLFSGCVHPKYRRRGLWKSLLAARQMCTASMGVRTWFLTTSNPDIMKTGDESYSYQIWVKK